MNEANKIQIDALIREEISRRDVELVDLVVSGHPNHPHIQVFVDQPDGMTVQTCAELSREIRDVIDREVRELDNYRLDVSSPGLDRPLKTNRDFNRHLGQTVQVYYTSGDRNVCVTGKIESVKDQEVILSEGDRQISVSIESIHKARIKLKW